MPSWNPCLCLSLLFVTRGTPKLISTLAGSKQYSIPIPAEIDGFEIELTTVSLSEVPVK